MATDRLIVLEINEIPRRVIDRVVDAGLAPNIASMLSNGGLIETEIREALPREMYPSQTWASFGTGRPWSDHGVWWYHDPKPEQFPFYWQRAAAAGKSVGLVNVLHSSPLDHRFDAPEFRFVVPDCFATEASTKPDRLESFQRLNLRLTSANSRKTTMSSGDVGLREVVALRQLGLRPSTVGSLGRLVGGVALGRTPRERLRTGQFLLLKDMFSRLVRDHEPDLCVLFTNHVAAAMHRYWYAMFPEDFANEWYDEAWVSRYRNEIPSAVATLDSFVGDMLDFGAREGYEVTIVSSMGQGASPFDAPVGSSEPVVVDSRRFIDTLGLSDIEIGNAMTPQISLRTTSVEEANNVVLQLRNVQTNLAQLDVDVAATTVTITYGFSDGKHLEIDGRSVSFEDAGVSEMLVDDHSSGRHIPKGILLSSLPFGDHLADTIDYLDASAVLLARLGVDMSTVEQR